MRISLLWPRAPLKIRPVLGAPRGVIRVVGAEHLRLASSEQQVETA